MTTQPRKGFVSVPPKRQEPRYEPPPEPPTPLEPPTLEQCENAALALGLPILPEGMRPSYYEESMRNLHALMVRTLCGDAQAEKALDVLRAAFGRQP